ncbi:MAG: hypothetical protein ACLP9K_04120 [Nitrososphaerales archaeon]
MHAELCVVCGGSGKVKIPAPEGNTVKDLGENPCHGCGGLGWVQVGDENPA